MKNRENNKNEGNQKISFYDKEILVSSIYVICASHRSSTGPRKSRNEGKKIISSQNIFLKDVGCSIEIPKGMQTVEETIQGVQIIRAKKQKTFDKEL